jgi:GNAT superfamily N-acetyltransferase
VTDRRIEVRALRPEGDRTRFRSGDPDLDRFFLRFAGQNRFKHHLGVTYIAVEGGTILGFATVAAAQIEAMALPPGQLAGIPRHPLPVLRLGRLAVSEAARGLGVGQLLVRFVLGLGQATAAQIGCVGILVDAKLGAVGFYEKLGFIKLGVFAGELGDRPVPTSMFLPLGSIPKGP